MTGDARRGHTSGVDHPRVRAYVHARACGPRHTPGWSAAVHGSGGQGAITSTITAGENCRAQTRSIDRVPNESWEIYFPPGKFIATLA